MKKPIEQCENVIFCNASWMLLRFFIEVSVVTP